MAKVKVTEVIQQTDVILKSAIQTLFARGELYDTASRGERSMGRIVAAFNAISGRDITEHEGWMFMVLLKLTRANSTPGHRDSYIDAAAYVALMGENGIEENTPC
jgi:hypothetical protein